MTTRVGLGATCYSNPDDDTCRVGCYIEVAFKLPPPDDDTCRAGCYLLPQPR